MADRIAVIPAYEPDDRLVSLACELSNNYIVIIVDDGSGKQCSEFFERSKEYAIVLHHTENQGKGCALKTAFQYIKKYYSGKYFVVTLDSDGQHTVFDADKVISEAEKDQAGLIIGSRRLEENAPLRSRFGNSVTRNVFRIFTGKRIYDTQSGLRAFSSDKINFFISVAGERYEYEMNVLLKCHRHGISIYELPIATIYFDKNSGSHFKTIADSFRIYKDIFRYGLKK